jgi:hypothetical protein
LDEIAAEVTAGSFNRPLLTVWVQVDA